MAKSTAVETTMEAPCYTRTASLSIPLPQHLETSNLKKLFHYTAFRTLHLTSSYQHMTYIMQAKAQAEETVSGGETHSFEGHCGHFSITHCLIIRMSSHSRPLGPGKGSSARTLCSHPASPFPVQILHSPTLRHVLKSNTESHYIFL